MKTIIAGLLLLVVLAPAEAQNKKEAEIQWHKLGATQLDLNKGVGEIFLEAAPKVTSVRLMVHQNPIWLESFDLYFENGSVQTVDYGGYDPVKIKNNAPQALKKVVLKYKSIDQNDQRAVVEIYGTEVAARGETRSLPIKKPIIAAAE